MSARIPARTIPLLFLGTAHVSLALAFLFAACWPAAVAGSFYHAWLVGGVGAWSLLASVVLSGLDNVFVVKRAVQTKAVWQEAA